MREWESKQVKCVCERKAQGSLLQGTILKPQAEKREKVERIGQTRLSRVESHTAVV